MSKTDEKKDMRTRKSARRQSDQIDLSKALDAPVRIKCDGDIKSIDPYEAMLRQHVRKSLIKKSVASMKLLLGEAEKHKLIKEPKTAQSGGVFVVPKDLPEEIQREIFAVPDNPHGEPVSIIPTFAHVYDALGLERLMRCFYVEKD